MHSVIIYYFLASSAVLFYGIGINKSISHSEDFSATMLTCIKSLFAAGSATAVTFLFSRWLLIPVHLTEIYPFIATLIFILFSTFVEIFIGIGIRKSPVDFSIPLLSVFLALNEGMTIGSAVVIACVCIISFYGMVLVFHCVRQRVSFYTVEGGLKNYCVLLICLAFIMIAICGFNITNLYFDEGARW
jgi:Na+-translocating ferredoxin:NAD+ oxidoreductase RnfA subunit